MSQLPLCAFCKVRVAGFSERHPHLAETERERHAQHLARACCAVWEGSEPEHWFGGRWER